MPVNKDHYDTICTRCNERRGEHSSINDETWCLTADGKQSDQIYMSPNNSIPSRHGLLWTRPEEEQLVSMFHINYSTKDIATALQRKEEAIEIRLEKLGYPDFKGALEKFQESTEKVEPPTLWNRIDGQYNIYHPGTIPASNCGVEWRYVEPLLTDYITLLNGGNPKCTSIWRDVQVKTGKTTSRWMEYRHFRALRDKANKIIENISQTKKFIEEEKIPKKANRVSPSVERRRLLLV